MAHASKRSEDVKTPLCTISFAENLFEAREDKWGNKSFQATLHFKKGTDLSALENAALDAATQAWGDKARQWIKEGVIKSPFLDGDGKQGKDKEGNPKVGHAGTIFIRCKSGEKFKPKVFDRKRNPVYEPADCTSGSEGYGVVNCFTWENDEQGKGLTFGISIFQVAKLAKGDEIYGGGGGPDPDKFLEKLDDEGEAPASTKSGAGAGGLFG